MRLIRKDKDFCNVKNIRNYKWETKDPARKKVPKTFQLSNSEFRRKGREGEGRGEGERRGGDGLRAPFYWLHNRVISLMSFKTVMKANFLQRLSRDLLTLK